MQGHLDNLGRDLFTVSVRNSVTKNKFMCESLLLVMASCKQRQGSSSRHVQGSCKRALEVGPGKGLVLSVVLMLRAMTEEPPVPWPGMAVAEMGGTGSEVAPLLLPPGMHFEVQALIALLVAMRAASGN
jgi:hypothetical protein